MPNTTPCGKCQRYSELFRETKAGPRSQHKGHCLQYTVYASNKPGQPVYPVGATVRDLPFGRHKIKLVREDVIIASCAFVKEKK